jgi:hypothetical protein
VGVAGRVMMGLAVVLVTVVALIVLVIVRRFGSRGDQRDAEDDRE